MKKISSILLSMVLANMLSAQGTAKKYLLIEHFTNSNCGVCANRNPAFFSLIGQAQYEADIHHVAVHPMFPYPSCIFYQANTVENSAWTALYPVQGTPTVVLNGAVQAPSNPIISAAKLQTYLGQTSPLSLQVTEAGPNNARTVNVKAKAVGQIPSGNYKIFVAIAEKTVNQQTPNGESVHHNVFRKMLTAVAGDAFTSPGVGETAEFNYSYSIPNGWNADEVYVLAFVKEIDTKQVLNSGTRFDPVLSSVQEATATTVRISPNPGSEVARVDLADDLARSVEVFDSNGQVVSVTYENQDHVVAIRTTSLAAGIYFVKIKGEKGSYVGKFVKK